MKYFILIISISISIVGFGQKINRSNIPVGHSSGIDDLSINQELKQIATVDNEKICLWDIETKRITKTITLPETRWSSKHIIFSNDLILADNNQIYLFNPVSGNLEHSEIVDSLSISTLDLDAKNHLLLMSFNETHLSKHKNNRFKVWDIEQKKLDATISQPNRQIKFAKFNSDKKRVITLEYNTENYNTYVCIYDWKNNSKLSEYETSSSASSVDFINEDKQFIVVFREEMISYDSSTGKKLITFPAIDVAQTENGTNQSISSIAISPDYKRISASYGWDKVIREFDLTSGEVLNECKLSSYSDKIAYFNNNIIIKTGRDHKNNLRLYDLSKGSMIEEWKSEITSIKSVKLSSQQDKILQLNDDGKAEVWEFTKGSNISTISLPNTKISSADFNLKSDKILTTSSDGFLRQIGLKNGKILFEKYIDSSLFFANYIKNDEQMLVCTKYEVLFFDTNKKKGLLSKPSKKISLKYEIQDIVLSPTKNNLAVFGTEGDETLISIIDLDKMKLIKPKFKGWITNGCNFNSDGNLISLNTCCSPIIYDIKNRQELKVKDQWSSESVFESFGGIFSRDDVYYAIIGDGLAIVNLKDTAQKVKSLEVGGYDERVEDVLFFDDNQKMLIQVENKLVIYDLQNEKRIAEFDGIEPSTYKMVMTKDENYALCYNGNQELLVLDLTTNDILFSRFSFSGNKWFVLDNENNFQGDQRALEMLKEYSSKN
jgi:WD40 repeat protein